MYSFLYRLGSWLLQKLAVGVLIVVLGVAAYGMWLFLRDHVDFDTRRAERLASLSEERDRLRTVRAEIEKRIEEMHAEIAAQEKRVATATRVMATLRELESWWERWFGNGEQQRANAEQIARMQELRAKSTTRIGELKQTATHTLWEREGIDIALGKAERQLLALEQEKSEAAHYLREAWERSKWYVAAALAAFFLGPTLWKLLLYYGFAPTIARTRPIRFADNIATLPTVGESHVSIDTALWPGDVLHVKEKFLQASDEGLVKKTRFVLDWRIPFTSVACGLVELVEMRNAHAGGELHVTLSNAEDPHTELAVIAVPEGTSIVLRPSFLAGVITPAGQPLNIRRRWQLFRWQAWVTLQFRFFEFIGPCRLLVAGSRGVRAEKLVEREGRRPARRANQLATIGFTPNLDYRPVRAETFWGYYRDMNPLFDDLFAGPGLFVLQETSTEGETAKPGKFWSTVWSGMLKVFGL
ncbi:MAG TPA: hypothetical protein VGD81_06305 [Opitutaceae bacterium]